MSLQDLRVVGEKEGGSAEWDKEGKEKDGTRYGRNERGGEGKGRGKGGKKGKPHPEHPVSPRWMREGEEGRNRGRGRWSGGRERV